MIGALALVFDEVVDVAPQSDGADRVEPAVDNRRLAGRAADREMEPMIVHRAEPRDEHRTAGEFLREHALVLRQVRLAEQFGERELHALHVEPGGSIDVLKREVAAVGGENRDVVAGRDGPRGGFERAVEKFVEGLVVEGRLQELIHVEIVFRNGRE